MSRESNSPSLFRVLAREALVEYTAAATVAGVVAVILYVLLPATGPSVLFAALSWSILSFALYMSYILRSSLPVTLALTALAGATLSVFRLTSTERLAVLTALVVVVGIAIYLQSRRRRRPSL